MTERKTARTGPKPEDKAGEDAAKDDAPAQGVSRDGTGDPHTELVPAGEGPRKRARVLPPEVGEDDGDDGDGGDDDLFNDMPV